MGRISWLSGEWFFKDCCVKLVHSVATLLGGYLGLFEHNPKHLRCFPTSTNVTAISVLLNQCQVQSSPCCVSCASGDLLATSGVAISRERLRVMRLATHCVC